MQIADEFIILAAVFAFGVAPLHFTEDSAIASLARDLAFLKRDAIDLFTVCAVTTRTTGRQFLNAFDWLAIFACHHR